MRTETKNETSSFLDPIVSTKIDFLKEEILKSKRIFVNTGVMYPASLVLPVDTTFVLSFLIQASERKLFDLDLEGIGQTNQKFFDYMHGKAIPDVQENLFTIKAENS